MYQVTRPPGPEANFRLGRRVAIQAGCCSAEMLKRMAKHTGRLDYRGRLAEGWSIGTGLAEGTIKTLGLRLKARGARWVERNVRNMAALVAPSQTSLRDCYWTLAA